MSILGIESLFCSSSEYMPRGHEVGILKGCLHSHSWVCACVHHCFSHDQPCVMLCTVAHQSPVGISRQEYCSGLPCPSPGDLPDPGIEPRSPVLQADSLPNKLWEKPYYNDNTSYIHSCVYIGHMHTYIVMYIAIYIVTISLFSDRHGFSHVDYWNNASI